MAPAVSVILCTHNPQPALLERVLAALRAQTLAADNWELLIVDNGSEPALAGRLDLGWHPHARILSEPVLGLNRARIRGIDAGAGALVVFVDDDNLLAPTYLENALRIGETHSFLGAWGGAVIGEFEQPPPAWATPYLPMLALREPATDLWSNTVEITAAMPCGAGLCVRRLVATTWAQRSRQDPARLSLDRIGKGLGAGGDADIAFTACDLGLGTGVLRALRVTHVIPPRRLTLEYLERLVEEMHCSAVVLQSVRQPVGDAPRPGTMTRLFRLYSEWRMPAPIRRLMRATDRGIRQGHAAVRASQRAQP
jgi:hypothetical protein